MFFSLRKKNIASFKIKKFYYYSPDKHKLIPIVKLIPKTIVTLLAIVIFIVILSVSITIMFDYTPNIEILANQKKAIEKQYDTELLKLNEKYSKLSEKFDKLKSLSNDVRLVVNLEPVNFKKNSFGIGGAEFVKKIELKSFYQNEKLSKIYNYVNDLEVSIKLEKNNYNEILEKVRENIDLFDKIPAIRPIKSSIGDRFGVRFHPILKRTRMHHGLDFLSNVGEKVLAPGDGIVTYIGKKGGYGKVVRINHGYGYETLFAHLSKYKVKKGQKIKRGELIALSGNSGSLSTGPHLHYEVRHNGVCLNPRNFIFEDTKLFDSSSKFFVSK